MFYFANFDFRLLTYFHHTSSILHSRLNSRMPQPPKGQAAAAQKLHERATLEITKNTQKVLNLKQTRINGNGSLSIVQPSADESNSTDSEGEEEFEDHQNTKTPRSFNDSSSSLTRTNSGSLTASGSVGGSLKRKHRPKSREVLLKIDQSYVKRLKNKVDNLINKIPNDNSEFRLIYFKMYVHYAYLYVYKYFKNNLILLLYTNNTG